MPYRTTKKGEIQQLQYEIANEISRDAPEIAKGVFGDNARHPDMATVSNAELDQLYLQKYLANDRQWLTSEAQRDPVQFLQVTDRIGVADPPLGPDGQPMAVPTSLEAKVPPEPVLQTMPEQAPPVAGAAPAVPSPVPPPGPAAALSPPPPLALPGT